MPNVIRDTVERGRPMVRKHDVTGTDSAARKDARVVEAAIPIYIFPAVWKNLWGEGRRSLNAVGFDPSRSVLMAPGFDESRHLLKQRDVVIFDSWSRPEFGEVADYLRKNGPVRTEVNNREIEVVGLFGMGSYSLRAIETTFS